MVQLLIGLFCLKVDKWEPMCDLDSSALLWESLPFTILWLQAMVLRRLIGQAGFADKAAEEKVRLVEVSTEISPSLKVDVEWKVTPLPAAHSFMPK